MRHRFVSVLLSAAFFSSVAIAEEPRRHTKGAPARGRAREATPVPTPVDKRKDTGKACATQKKKLTMKDDLLHPHGLVVDKGGNVLVANTFHNKVIKFSPEGKKLEELPLEAPKGCKEHFEPRGIALDPKGKLVMGLTLDCGTVATYDAKGKIEKTLVGRDAKVPYPYDLAYDSEGQLAVADTANSRIRIYDTEGKEVATFGTGNSKMQTDLTAKLDQGDGSPENFALPHGFTLHGDAVYVADTYNRRVVKCLRKPKKDEARCTVVREVPYMPYGIAFDEFGEMYVSAFDRGTIHRYPEGGDEQIITGISTPQAARHFTIRGCTIYATAERHVSVFAPL